MTGTHQLLILCTLLAIAIFFGSSVFGNFALYALTIPAGADLGISGAAIATGPLAPLWNPAGVVDGPGVHGAACVRLFADGSIVRAGVSIVALSSPAVAWDIVSDPDGNQTYLTFALPVSSTARLGLTLSYSFAEQGGLSLIAGTLFQAGGLTLGLGVANISSVLFGGSLPSRIRGGVALHSATGLRVAVDLSLSADETTLTLSGKAKIWRFGLQWWVGIYPPDGFAGTGLGISFDAFELPVELSIAVIGDGTTDELFPCATVAGEGTIPAWW